MSKILLNKEQHAAIKAVLHFLNSDYNCFILKGSAGTGKTTLIAELIRNLIGMQRRYELIAPTGRAARILGAKTNAEANTIHKVIYALSDVEVFESTESSNDPGLRFHFPLKREDPGNVLFIVDEASMVGDKKSQQDLLRFGSGRLLTDLIEYARIGRKGRPQNSEGKILFVGDPAQLPPVGETLSSALSSNYLNGTFGVNCKELELTNVMRQHSRSAVLDRATSLRNAIVNKTFNTFDITPSESEIEAASITDGVTQVTESQRDPSTSSVLITWSNAQALELNRAVRGHLWGDEAADLRTGDLLLVNKNSMRTELYNGDLVKVIDVLPELDRKLIRIKGVSEPVELKFRQSTVAYRESDGTTRHIQCRLLENLLDSRERELTPVEQRALLVDFRQRNPDLRPKTAEFRLAIREDSWFNALQVKYGYAMTCHKAQGGEWDTAVVDFSDSRGKRNEDFFRWAYTAITRAKSRLLTISAPRFDPYKSLDWGLRSCDENHAEMSQIVESTPATDPDWNRFSFAPGQEILFGYHLRLREAWSAIGIQVTRIEHLQYCERYYLERSGKQAAIQYWYKGNQNVSKVGNAAVHGHDDSLAEEAVSISRDVLLNETADAASDTEFIQSFREKVEKAIEGNGIRLVSSQPMQYRLRMEFTNGTQQGKIDFHYDGTQKWTRVEEVGGFGASHGLIDRVRILLDNS